MPEKLNEKKLIEETLAGDLSAFEKIVRHYQQPIFRHSLRILKNPDLAEDATQDTFIKFYETLPIFNKKKPIRPWIYKIATNLCFDVLRKHKKVVKLSWEIESPYESSIDRIIRQEESREIKKAIKNLPVIYKLPIVSHYFRNLSYKQIADALKLPLNTVRTRIKRGKELLAGMLKEKKL